MGFSKIILVSIFVFVIAIFIIVNNSKDKSDYQKSSGEIVFTSLEYLNFPVRHKGEYRFIKLSTYPFVFEIYKPNSERTKNTIDELKVGDKIEIYYYETFDTEKSQMNRYVQFIDMNNEPYFIRNNFQIRLGIVILILLLMINFLGFVFWKKNRLKW